MNSFTANVTMTQIYQGVTVDNLQNLFSSVNMMEEAARQLAYNIAAAADAQVAALHTHIPYVVGKTDGTASFNSTDILKPLNDARKQLMLNRSPMDDLVAVLGPTEAANFRSLSQLQKVNEAGGPNLLRNGEMGQILGFRIMESQQIATNVVMNDSSVTATPGAVNNASGYPVGTTTMAINSLGAGTVPAGTSFYVKTISGTKYTVTAPATITTNAATITFSPPLRDAVANSDAVVITEYTNAAGGESFGLAFNRNAILAVARPTHPFQAGSGINSVIVTDDQTGLSIRVATQSKLLDSSAGYSESIAADLVFGCEVVRPESAVKIAGAV
jgi:hypothetical protein